ncbi:MAG TPA: response regulator [Spirochaetota bacterium]|nr:response regulator [Spirochaetota bacterium]HPJ37408.1 response regulator [Spirochaetota bacterium]HPQ53802.1 response regulator [Spirochaetota bacterium]
MADEKIILVIDDDPDILDSVKAILSSNGFKVETALTGKEGLELVKKVNPDLVLVDMMMESIDAGSKVAHEIRESDQKLPVYLLSSIGSATAANIEIDKLGFNGVFQKPVDPDNLVSSVKRSLGM